MVTVGALITMAAHLEGKGASVLDFTGFAQKFGPVLSYIRLAQAPDAITSRATRAATRSPAELARPPKAPPPTNAGGQRASAEPGECHTRICARDATLPPSTR